MYKEKTHGLQSTIFQEEDPFEEYEPLEESDLESKEVVQPALPMEPLLPRCLICGSLTTHNRFATRSHV